VIVPVGLLVAGMGSLGLVILELRKAPEGYEDERGFHSVCQITMGYGLPGLMIQNTRRDGGPYFGPIVRLSIRLFAFLGTAGSPVSDSLREGGAGESEIRIGVRS
jgi:hypothetical protein